MEIRRLILVGAGALGSFFLLSAGRVGVDRIDVFDGDIVREENIGNQPIFSLQDARKALYKTDALMKIKTVLRPTELVGHNFYVTGRNMENLPLGKHTVIVDCTDNVETKLLLNALAVKEKIPLLSLSAHGAKGSVYLMDGREACLECIYGGVFDKLSRTGCDRLSPVYASFVSSVGVDELSFFTKSGRSHGFISIDAEKRRIETVHLKKSKECSICVKRYFNQRISLDFIQLCGNSIKMSVQHDVNIQNIKRLLKGKKRIVGDSLLVENNGKEVFLSPSGDILFTGYLKDEAERLLRKIEA